MTPKAATKYPVGTHVSIRKGCGWILFSGDEMRAVQHAVRGVVANVEVVRPGRSARRGSKSIAHLDVAVVLGSGEQVMVRVWDQPKIVAERGVS